MKKQILVFLIFAAMGSMRLTADTCTFSHWRISQEGAVSDWADSIEATKDNPNWVDETKWQMNRGRVFNNGTTDVYSICEVTADSDYTQGLSMTGKADVRLNGVELEPYHNRQIFALELKKGTNALEIRVPKLKKKGKGLKLLLTRVELAYMYVPLEGKIVAARRAIEALGKMYPDYKATAYLKRLEKIGNDDVAVERLRYRALVLDNPEIDFDQILFRASINPEMPINWRGNSGYLRRRGVEMRPALEDEIRTLNLKTRKFQTIYSSRSRREGVMDLCLDFEAEKFLYSGVNTENNTFQIYEMNTDGSGKRQITSFQPELDHYNGIYLPNGKILFCSTASLNAVPCVYGSDYVGNLYEINSDGTGMRQVTFDQENDWYPWVTDDGRVMYLRWEYTDNSHYFTRILMKMNPDGTNLRSIYGSNSYFPNTMFYAKQIPGKPSQFAAICSGHHGVSRAGELIVFDTAKGEFEGEGVVQRIPGYGKKVDAPVIDQYMAGKWPRFLHPYPLSENFFLVSAQLDPDAKWALYLVDRFDNMIKLAGAEQHFFEPVPVKARKRPPVIPDRRIFDAEDATLFIQDIYEGPGLKDVPRGTVKALRLFTYGYAYRMVGGHDALAIEGGWDTKRVLGTVPVEEDGSAMFKIPHSMPISIQPLDAKGQALQIMRSWLAAMPGENLSCIGCHEPSNAAPPGRVAAAAHKAPQQLTPYSDQGKPYGFGFKREVQPVLDQYCVGCHNGKKENRPNFQNITEDTFGSGNKIRRFGKSYMALHPYVRRPGPESDMHLLPPMEYHASTSELIQILDKGHYGVELADADYRKLVTWIDLNVPYHATWMEERDHDADTRRKADDTVRLKKLYAGIDDNIEWMPDGAIERPAFVKPDKKPAKNPPIELAGWPLTETQIKAMAGETKTVKIGGKPVVFAKIPAGKFVMGSVEGTTDEAPQVAEVEKAFWISTKEITNAEYNQFDPKHNSGAIDQQWKDHIYGGYPADKPEQPVIRISWNEAMAYCEWASKETGKEVTLPSEAQWEWAARAGSGQPFHFDKAEIGQYANLADKNIELLAVQGVDPQPVPESQRTPLTDFVPRDASFDDGNLIHSGTGLYKPNPWGLYDMHGNVAEWTRSDYDGTRKAVRGGSWRTRPHRATASCRLGFFPYQKVANTGIRLVIED